MIYKILLWFIFRKIPDAKQQILARRMFDVVRVAYWFKDNEDYFNEADTASGLKCKHKEQLFTLLKQALEELEKECR